MVNLRDRIVEGMAGVFGLPLEERALWPDIVLGALTAFALLFSLGSLAEKTFDRTFLVATISATCFVLLAREKLAVLSGALFFVGLRFFNALVFGVPRALPVVAICLAAGGLLLWLNGKTHC